MDLYRYDTIWRSESEARSFRAPGPVEFGPAEQFLRVLAAASHVMPDEPASLARALSEVQLDQLAPSGVESRSPFSSRYPEEITLNLNRLDPARKRHDSYSEVKEGGDDFLPASISTSFRPLFWFLSQSYLSRFLGTIMLLCLPTLFFFPLRRLTRALFFFDLPQPVKGPGKSSPDEPEVAWPKATGDEKMVLYQLVKDGWASPKSAATLKSLIAKGLVQQSGDQPAFHVEENLGAYIRERISEYSGVEVRAHEPASQWGGIRLALVMLLLLIAVLLLSFARQELLATLVTLVTLVSPLLSLILGTRRENNAK